VSPSARRSEGGQATVELALLLPVLVLLLLLAVQAALLARDRVLAVHAARVAGRAVIVEPTAQAARAALQRQGGRAAVASVDLVGDRRPGEVVTVVVAVPATRVPIVGRVIGTSRVEERLSVLVEGEG